MEIRGAVEDMTEEQLLGHVESVERGRREHELALLRAAREWAARRGPGSIGTGREDSPYGDRLRCYGGEGTPQVASSAGVVFGARIGRSTSAGDRYIATVLDLDYRLPRLLGRVEALEVEVSSAMFVARKTRHLSIEEAAYVDARVAESADGRLPWSRFEALVEAAIKAADPEAARQREEEARRRQFARKLRSREDGIGVFMIRAAWPIIVRLDATVGMIARILKNMGMEGTEDELRVRAMLLISNPPAATALLAQYAAWRERPADPDPETGQDQEPSGIVKAALDLTKPTRVEPTGEKPTGEKPPGEKPTVDWSRLLPQIVLFVHTYGGQRQGGRLVNHDRTGIARIEGYGGVTEAWVRDYLGPQARFTIRPVIDIEGQAPVDGYDIPDRHRQAVRLMTPADIFPFATATTNQDGGWNPQLDHTIAWRPTTPGHDGACSDGGWCCGDGECSGDGGGDGGRGEGEKLSRIGNYGPMTQRHHNLKTHGGWQVKQPFPGIYLWRDPWGGLYLVDHTGTRKLHTWTTDIDLVYTAA